MKAESIIKLAYIKKKKERLIDVGYTYHDGALRGIRYESDTMMGLRALYEFNITQYFMGASVIDLCYAGWRTWATIWIDSSETPT